MQDKGPQSKKEPPILEQPPLKTWPGRGLDFERNFRATGLLTDFGDSMGLLTRALMVLMARLDSQETLHYPVYCIWFTSGGPLPLTLGVSRMLRRGVSVLPNSAGYVWAVEMKHRRPAPFPAPATRMGFPGLASARIERAPVGAWGKVAEAKFVLNSQVPESLIPKLPKIPQKPSHPKSAQPCLKIRALTLRLLL